MDPSASEAFTRVVTDALQEPEGQRQIETVKGMLYSALLTTDNIADSPSDPGCAPSNMYARIMCNSVVKP
jgi:hypothetical protein